MQSKDKVQPAVSSIRHPNPIRVWAGNRNGPLRYDGADGDARLAEEDRDTGADQPYGQSGWDVTVDFGTFDHLARLLAGGEFELPSYLCKNWFLNCGPIEENQIERLGILAHGIAGGIAVDGASSPLDKVPGRSMLGKDDPLLLNVNTIDRYLDSFRKIERVLAHRAKVLLVSCCSGQGSDGAELMRMISRVWSSKEVFVIGYSTILFSSGDRPPLGQRKGVRDYYPGVRETHDCAHGDKTRYYRKPEHWLDLSLLPWASEFTPHAIVAYRGLILKKPHACMAGWTPGWDIPPVQD